MFLGWGIVPRNAGDKIRYKKALKGLINFGIYYN